MTYTPPKGDVPGYEAFNFLIRGIEFRLLLGERIPEQLRAPCSQQSVKRCIVSLNIDRGDARDFHQTREHEQGFQRVNLAPAKRIP
jgi:hypothetical protein